MTSSEIDSIMQREMGPREKLLWSGAPRKGLVVRRSDWITIPFFMVWSGVPLSGLISSLKNGQRLSDHLWSIPFLAIGLYMLAGRFLSEALQRGKTYYGVTNERVIIVSLWFGKNTKSLGLQALHEMSVEEKADGSGTITFSHSLLKQEVEQEKIEHHSFKLSPSTPTKKADYDEAAAPRLELIPNVKSVFNLIRAAQYDLQRKAF